MARQRQQQKPEEFEIDISQEDFSPKAIEKALQKHTFGHWSFRYPLVGVLLTLLAIPLFGWSYPIFVALLATAGFSVVSFVWNYFISSDKFLHKHMDKLQQALQFNAERKMAKLKKDLQDHHHAKLQVEQVDRVFENLTEILEHKFNTSELTYKRYYGMAQEVFLSAIDNLSEIVLSLKSIEEIDKNYIKQRLKELDRNDAFDSQEIETLEKRMDLLHKTEQKIRSLLIENEKAMTLMNETAIEIAKIDVNDQEGKIDMENSMKQLSELIKHSQDYSL